MSNHGFHVHGPHDHVLEHAAQGHGDGFTNKIALLARKRWLQFAMFRSGAVCVSVGVLAFMHI